MQLFIPYEQKQKTDQPNCISQWFIRKYHHKRTIKYSTDSKNIITRISYIIQRYETDDNILMYTQCTNIKNVILSHFFRQIMKNDQDFGIKKKNGQTEGKKTSTIQRFSGRWFQCCIVNLTGVFFSNFFFKEFLQQPAAPPYFSTDCRRRISSTSYPRLLVVYV